MIYLSMIKDVLNKYLKDSGLSRTDDKVRFVHFSNNNEDSDEDIANLISGKKTAAFTLKEWFSIQTMESADVGSILVFADYFGVTKSFAKVVERETVTYGNISAEVTQGIGLGDGSVETFKNKRAHFLKTCCEIVDVEFNDDTEIFIYWLELIYPSKTN